MNSRLSFWRLVGPVVASIFIGSLTPPALADDQSERIKALERQLQTSLQLIEKLSARVSDLERAAGNAAPKDQAQATARKAADAQDVARLQETVNEISAGLARRDSDTGLPLHGFADVGVVSSSRGDPVRLHGFSGGTVDLYLTPEFGSRIKALAEIALEFEQDGAGTVDMERLQLGYTASDQLTLWMGRFHAPFGLWNTLFHHGANLQTSVFRPRFIEFEDKGGIIPAHAVGVWASGNMRLGNSRISYDGYLSNGPSIRERRLDPNTFADDDSGKLLGFRLGVHPVGVLGGLSAGIHGFGSTVKAYTSSNALLSSTRLRVAGAYFGYDADDWEGIGEFYHFDNADSQGGARHASNAWFVHLGRAFGPLTPYLRFERTSLDPGDNYFRSLQTGRSYQRSVVGARYALDARAAVKLELSNTNENAMLQLDESGTLVPFTAASYRRAAFQYSIAF